MLHAETVALKLAHVLIPTREDDERNLFFMEGARSLLAGLITAFFLDDGEVRLRDVRTALRTKEGMREVLERHPQTRYLVEWYFPSEYIFRETLATLASELAGHEDLAGLSFRLQCLREPP
jgi:hypothetical protein